MRKLAIAMLAIFALLIAFMSAVSNRVWNEIKAEYSHLPKASDYGADYTASVKVTAPGCQPNCPTDISASKK
jgi:Na+-transporting methylmalonyl-CoA/oxaloacetate decarboxylase gamma subunit